MRRCAAALTALAVAVGAAPVAAKPRSGVLSTDLLGKPSGARFIALGESGAALPGVPQSPLYNPAALESLPATYFGMDFDVANQSALSKDVILKNSSLRGRKLTYIGFAAPSKAVFYRPLAKFDDRVVTVSTDPLNNFTENSLSVNQFGISASQKTEQGYSVGLGLSYVSARRGVARAAAGEPPVLEIGEGNGFAVDWGFRDEKGPFLYGLTLQNLPGFIYWDRYRTDQLPVLGRAGLAFRPVRGATFLTDYEKRFYQGGLPRPELWHFGLEVVPASWLALRAGALSEDFNNRNKTVFSCGLGLGSTDGTVVDLFARSEYIQDTRVFRYGLSFLYAVPVSTEESRRR